MLDKIAKHFDFQQKRWGCAYRTEVLSATSPTRIRLYKAVDFNFKDAMTRAIGEAIVHGNG